MALLVFGQLGAQTHFNCGFNHANEKLFSIDPSAKHRFEAITAASSSSSVQNKNSNTVYVIPVVFHVLHQGGNENISDAQIQSAVNILNRDFRKQNSDTSQIVTSFKNIAADCSMQFSLATKDENGNCTNGITRHYDSKTFWTDIQMSNYAYTWNPTKYLNIYVVKALPNGTAGYTYLPGTAGGVMDAIVILHGYVGNIGTANNFSSRSLTHEVGHWFNLSHVWGNTNNPGVACGDDGVSDTPITRGSQNCNTSLAVCTPGVVENVQNYMDYSFCSRMFTIGQKDRMHTALNSSIGGRNNLWQNSNLIATGVVNPNTVCTPKAEFFTSNTVTCVGNSVTFTDFSYNAPVTSWQWSSNLASNTSTVQSGSLTFTNSGLAQVKLKVSNSAGSDSLIKQYVIVLAGANSGNLNITESFESLSFPNSNWQASVPAYGTAFQKTGLAAATGSASLWLNNYFDSPSEKVSFFSPSYNLQGVSSLLSFKYAYARKSSQDNDQFKIFLSTNCGSSWTQVYSKAGATLGTTASFVNTNYTSPDPAEWKTEYLSVANYSTQSSVHFKFEFTPDPNGTGNNFFVDDINLLDVTSVRENASAFNLNVFPNPFEKDFVVENKSSIYIETVNVYSVDMKKLATIEVNSRESELKINHLNSLSSGVYFIGVLSHEGNKVFKVIKS